MEVQKPFLEKVSGRRRLPVCHGLRRTGKSSLLYRIASRGFTDPRLVPIYIDMQGIDDEKDFYATVSGKIREKLTLIPGAPIGTPGDGPSAGHPEGPTGGWTPATAVESFVRFKEFLKEIEPHLGHCTMVLMVDEFEELQMRVEDRRISRTIFSHIRHLMQHEEKLAEHFSQQIWDDATPLERLLLSAAAEEMTRRQLDFIGLDTLCTQVEAAAKDYSRKPMLDALEKLDRGPADIISFSFF